MRFVSILFLLLSSNVVYSQKINLVSITEINLSEYISNPTMLQIISNGQKFYILNINQGENQMFEYHEEY